MIRGRFLWKLYLAFAALIVLSGVVTSLALSKRLYDNDLAQVRSNLEHQAEALEQSLVGIDTTDLSIIRERTEALGEALACRLTVIDRQGVVLSDSRHDPAAMENHKNRPEVAEAWRLGVGEARRYSSTLNRNLFYVAVRGRFAEEPMIFRAAVSLAFIEDRLATIRWTILAAHGLVGLAALVLGFIFARAFTIPLTAMTRTATAIARGDLDRRLDPRGIDEVGQLARAFNLMSDQLAHRIETLSAERNKLQRIITSMLEGLIAVDEHQVVIHINASAAELLRLQPTPPGRHLWEACRVADIHDAFDQVLASGGFLQRELRLTQTDGGGDRHLDMRITALRTPDGAISGAVAIFHDLTEIRRLEAMRRDFVANVSHELKTPLTAIIGMLETIVDDADMPADMRTRFLERVHQQARRLSSLVVDLLTLSRLETPDAARQVEACDLTRLIRETLAFLREAAAAKHISLAAELAEATCLVQGDEALLRQAIDNLIDNALKYTPENGHVSVSLERTDEHARIAITDNGIGITRSDQNRIFERFYRVDKARSRHLGGTGLGLAIVKHIARIHGGDIAVASVPGSGSTFTLQLPVAADDAEVVPSETGTA